MKVRIVPMLILACFGMASFASGQTADCGIFHKGVFHVYLIKTGQHYIVYRDDQTEKEVVEGSTDTSVWHINWVDSCNYTLQLASNGAPLTAAQQRFLKKHKLFYHLQPGGKDFCVYTETLDKAKGGLIEKDTMRLHELAVPNSAPLVMEVKSESLLRGMHFSDTSSYAVLYLYRPSAMLFSPYPYAMYIDDYVLCRMKNNSSFIFALYRPGRITLHSRVYTKDSCSLSLDIEPGKSYYVRSTVRFGIYGKKDYKLGLELMPVDKGKEEFDRTFK